VIAGIRRLLFCRALERKHGTGKRFTHSYVRFFERSQAKPLRGFADLDALDGTRRMWFDYAISTNSRGRDLIAALSQHKNFQGSRYLDIGCGFGGCLVAAAGAGASCVGIEVDAERIAFAQDNVRDFGIAGEILNVDALEPELVHKLGQFDAISCNDVLEHVADAGQLVNNIARLLKPGGVAYAEIPNGDAIDFVASDGHFGLFGITLLDRPTAMAYQRMYFRSVYDVGEYISLDGYHNMFERAGFTVELIPSLYHPALPIAETDSRLALLTAARQGFAMEQCEVRSAIELAYDSYLRRLSEDRTRLPEDEFRNRYLRSFWTFLLRAN
jgi:2-polyprenyl-3-methyl-5-hydroxy-6-metoxy-1,4-benzoquinol methylase